MRYLTRVVVIPFGANILGLLEVFAVFGVMAFPESLRGVVFLTLSVVLMAFDVWCRSHQPEVTLWGRLLSPFSGGCFFFVPIWFWIVVVYIVAFLAFIVKIAATFA